MVLTSSYLLNLLCTMVPCGGTQPLPEAYIQDFSLREGDSSISRLDPIYSNGIFPDDQINNRRKRLQEGELDSPAQNIDDGEMFGDQYKGQTQNQARRTSIDTGNLPSSPFQTLIPNLISSISIPVIPALFNSIMRGLGQGRENMRSREAGAGRSLSYGDNDEDSNDRSNRNTRNSKPPVVFTKYGGVLGYFMGTMKGRKISAFEGIPYAQPPIGKYRFKAPVPKFPWKNVIEADKPGSSCLQTHPLDFFRVTGSEDCLYLNVYTPQNLNTRSSKLMPVIFLIHGGSFQYGSGGEYGPAYMLSNEDVILVTLNYRLGPLGFLSTGDEASPGNFGLKDQGLALKWVNENIGKFGGDKNAVTIMGQSAGAVSAHLHLVANKTTEYFQKGVSLSGSGFGHWPVTKKARAVEYTKRLAGLLNCPSSGNAAMMKCLRTASAAWITGSQMLLFDWIPFHPLVLFGPTVEEESPESFLTKLPQEAYDKGEVMNKPWIFGQTRQEGHFELYFIKLMMQNINVNIMGRKLLPKILDYAYTTSNRERTQVTEELLNFYGGSILGNGVELEAISDMYTDRFYTSTVRKAINAHSLIAPTYAYIFDYKGKYNLGSLFGAQESEWGVSHTEDLFYFFNSSTFHHGLKQSDPEHALSQIMTNILGNFVTQGKPYYDDPKQSQVDFWKPAYEMGDASREKPLQYLKIGADIEMISDPFKSRVNFWESLGIEAR